MWVTMVCKFPNPCWFAINAQSQVQALPRVINPEATPEVQDNTLAELNKYWDIFYTGWNNRPDIPAWLNFGKGSLPAVGLEATEGFIDMNIEVMNDIRHERYKDENLYTDVERDRVETLGFRPIWSPGGFQV